MPSSSLEPPPKRTKRRRQASPGNVSEAPAPLPAEAASPTSGARSGQGGETSRPPAPGGAADRAPEPAARSRAPTLNEAFSAYIAWAEAQGRHTAPERSRWRRHAARRLGEAALGEASPERLRRLWRRLRRRLSAQSAAHVLNLVRRVYGHAIRQGLWNGPSPLSKDGFVVPAPDNAGRRIFCPDEARRVLDHLRRLSPELHDMSLLSLKTGLRATEILALRWSDADLAGGVLSVRGKGGRTASLDMDQELIGLFAARKAAARPDDFIFLARRPRNRRVPRLFARTLQRLGLNEDADPRGKAWFHTWRHAYASWLAQSGAASLDEISALLRHETRDATLRYVHAEPACGAEALAAAIPRLIRRRPETGGAGAAKETKNSTQGEPEP